MVLRHRERDLRILESGTDYWPLLYEPDTAIVTKLHGLVESCDDVLGNSMGANSFQKSETFTHYPSFTFTRYNGSGVITRKFDNCPLTSKPAPVDPRSHWGVKTALDLNNLAFRILAETNPSEAHVSLPQFVGELRELPSLIKGFGDTLLKKVAAGHLTWRWCVRPMIGDLQKLWTFQKGLDDRLISLHRLRAGHTLRRRCHLGTDQYVGPKTSNHLFQSSGTTIRGELYTTFFKEEWGTACYSLSEDSNLPTLGHTPLNNWARDLTFGMTSHGALQAAWELTPWSWLVDWFSNVGDVIAATNNSVPCTWSRLCYMRHLKSVTTCKPGSHTIEAGVAIHSDYVISWERKERYPVFPVIPIPLPYLPILDGGKLSILASLAALRR